MSFKTELCLKVMGKQAYEVIEPLVYDDGLVILQVNPKFDFDGASIPKALWSIVGSPMTDGYQRAGCLHDALYAGHIFPKEICDRYFLEAMKSDGVGYVKRYAMYLAVRAFGGSSYANDSEEEVNAYKKYVTYMPLV